jgi:hypothetical protein
MHVTEGFMKSLVKRQPKQARLVELAPIRSEVMGVDQFLILSKRAPLDIKRSRFLPPKLGEAGFGRVEVEYSIPILRQAVES